MFKDIIRNGLSHNDELFFDLSLSLSSLSLFLSFEQFYRRSPYRQV